MADAGESGDDARLAPLLNAAPMAMLVTDRGDTVRYANQAAGRLWQVPPDSLVGQNLAELWPGEGLDPVRARLASGGGADAVEAPFMDPARSDAGAQRWFAVTVTPTTFAGEDAWFWGLAEITAQKHAQADLEKSQRQLAQVMTGIDVGIWDHDIATGTLVHNARFWSLLGYAPQAVDSSWLTRHIDDSYFDIHPDDRDAFFSQYREYLESTGAQPLEAVYRMARADGSYAWIALKGKLALDEGGWRFVGAQRDITAEREAQEALRQAKDEAEAASRAKSNFLAMMSHEIRTPMNGILGMVELLKRTPMDAQQNQVSAVIQESAHSLLTIIDDILDFSRIEAGRLTLDAVSLDPTQLVEGTVEALATQAANKELRLSLFCDPRLPTELVGDPVRLRQVLFNLIGNAIKFTHEGHVAVRLSLGEAGTAPGEAVTLHGEVADTGIGLTEQQRANLFSPFTQAEETTTRRYGGTGLGLSIAKRLVEMMGGQIDVDSTPNQGSSFRFDVRLALPEAGWTAAELPDLAGLDTAVADANPRAREAFCRYLEGAGARARRVASAAEARALAGTADVLVLHANLGEAEDPVGLAEAIAGAGTAVGMLADRDEPALRELAADSGIASFLAEPIRRSRFLSLVARLAGRQAGDPGALAEAGDSGARQLSAGLDREQASAEGRMLLVAEDNETNRSVIDMQLRQLGCAADLAEDGRSALAAFQQRHYDLVITDLHMPEMSGYELTHRLRKLEEQPGRHVPIVALTADALAGTEEQVLQEGLDGYLAKPVSLASLRETLESYLGGGADGMAPASEAAESGAAAAGEAPAGGSSGQAGDAAAVEGQDTRPIDRNVVVELFGEISPPTVQMLEIFVTSTRQQLDELRGYLDAQNVEAAHRTAHALKGAARGAGAMQLGELFYRQQMALKNEELSAANALMPQVEAAFERAAEDIEGLKQEIDA